MRRLLIPAALAAALAVAACGGSSSESATPPSAKNATVSVKSIDGVGKVLVDPHGMALYTSNLDGKDRPACVGACTSIWKPLTLASGTPSGAAGTGTVGTVMRADGMRQVTVAGRPLYTFVQDTPGKASGNGVSDAFSGRHFTWSAVVAGGRTAAAGSAGQSASGSSGYGSGGGY